MKIYRNFSGSEESDRFEDFDRMLEESDRPHIVLECFSYLYLFKFV